MDYLVAMRDERYRPFDIEELEDKVSLLNEPIREVIEPEPGQSAASLYALLERMETRGVRVPRDGQQREAVRELYVQTKRQVQALAACLALEGLE